MLAAKNRNKESDCARLIFGIVIGTNTPPERFRVKSLLNRKTLHAHAGTNPFAAFYIAVYIKVISVQLSQKRCVGRQSLQDAPAQQPWAAIPLPASDSLTPQREPYPPGPALDAP